jgi:hypothetical protein
MGITPDGENLSVFAPEEEPYIQSIVKVPAIVKIKDLINKKQQLINIVNNSTEPMIIKRFCMFRIGDHGCQSPNYDPSTREQFIEWRESQKQSPELREAADLLLLGCSPEEYEWSEERLAFLHKIKNIDEVPEELKHRIKWREDKAQKDKLLFEEDRRTNIKADK